MDSNGSLAGLLKFHRVNTLNLCVPTSNIALHGKIIELNHEFKLKIKEYVDMERITQLLHNHKI